MDKILPEDFERSFFEQLDPWYHFLQANCIKNANANELDLSVNDGPISDHEIGQEFFSSFEAMQRSSMRFIRYHAIETFFTILCGSKPHGPVMRFSHIVRNSEFNKIIKEIGGQRIPELQSLSSVLEYKAWLACKFFGALSEEHAKNILSQELVDFISLQARLYVDKSAYNAFKHGCQIGEESPEIKVTKADGDDPPIYMKLGPSIKWYRWEESKKKPCPTIVQGYTECDIEDDHSAIFIIATLVRAMRKARLAKKGEHIEIMLPEEIATKRDKPKQIVLRIKFGD